MPKVEKRKKVLIGTLVGISLLAVGGLAGGLSYLYIGRSANTYTVTWQDENNNVLEVDKDVVKGTMPSYDGIAPTKDADREHIYRFDRVNSWDKELTLVTADITYTANKFIENEQNLEYEYVKTDSYEGYSVKGFKEDHKDDAEVFIASTFKGETGLVAPVVEVGFAAFTPNLENIKSGDWSIHEHNVTLTHAVISDSVKSIGAYALEGCDNLTVELSREHSQLEKVGDAAFSNTDNREMHFPESALDLGKRLFSNNPIEKVTLPSKLTTIPQDLFFHTWISQIVWPQSLERIERGAFRMSIRLENLIIPDGVTYIGTGVLSTEIEVNRDETYVPPRSVYIPSSVTHMDWRAIDGESADITTIYCGAKQKPEGWNDEWFSNANVKWGVNRDEVPVA